MYDVAPFVAPVPLNYERSPDKPNDEQELMAFRRDISAGPMGEMVREHLGIWGDDETGEKDEK